MKKKKIMGLIIGIICVICIVLIGYIVGIINIPGIGNVDGEETDLERISKVMNTTRPTEVFIMGENITFEVDVTSTTINKLSAETVKSDRDYKVIIINDLNDKIELSDEEVNYAKDIISKNGYFLIYLGEKYSTVWDKTDEGIANLSGNLCFSYYSWDGEPRRNIGNWLQSDQDELDKYPYSLGQALLYCIEDYLMSGEV